MDWKVTATGKTAHECEADHCGARFTVPTGTEAIQIDGNSWAVKSAQLVRDLTGDEHGAQHYFAWLPADAITKEA
jgi:hypothetical protein